MAATMSQSRVNVHQKHHDFRREVLTAHQALRRSLGQIIQLAPTVQYDVRQQKHFLVYCSTFLEFLHEHHTIEDTICFPLLSKPCGLEADIAKLEEEHDTLTKHMDDLKHMLQQPFDGKKIQAAATALRDMMCEHLAFEESVMLPLEVIARADLSVMEEMRKKIDSVLKQADPFTILPFFISHLTADEADFMVFNSAPWLLKHLLLPLVFSRKHKKAWKFAPTTMAPQQVATAC